MYKVTRVLDLHDPDDELTTAMAVKRLRSAADASPAIATLVAPTLPGVRNGGDLLVHLQFREHDDWLRSRSAIDEATSDSSVRSLRSVEYIGATGDRAGRRSWSPQVYRTLLLNVEDSASPEQLHHFERATLAMPQHIQAIGAWQLSRVVHVEGGSRYTHVWEQEFSDLADLHCAYMFHPIHWGLVDRWFDPECPDRIIADRVCHSFCASPAPLIDAVEATNPHARAR